MLELRENPENVGGSIDLQLFRDSERDDLFSSLQGFEVIVPRLSGAKKQHLRIWGMHQGSAMIKLAKTRESLELPILWIAR